MQVISINEKQEDKRREDMLEVLNELRAQVEAGEVSEFVACSLDSDGLGQIHVSTLDVPGAVGLFEIGKHLLISQEA